MPKKKQVRNAFYYFMLDYKAEGERNGEVYPNGLRDVQELAGPAWNALPPAQRKMYEDRAKEEKLKLKGEVLSKVTCGQTPYRVVEGFKSEEEKNRIEMNTYIENKIRSLQSKKMLAEQKFYLVHVNYFCISEGDCYHPAELAISEFCLSKGVTNVYNTIIDPGSIPLGYRSDAIRKSNESHKIPVEGNKGEQSFYNILMNVKRFLEPGKIANHGVYPPMFTMNNVNLNTNMYAVKSVMMNLLGSDTGSYAENTFKIYSLEKLFLELRRACNQLSEDDEDSELEDAAIPAMSVAQTELEKDVFNYISNIACSFHDEEEAVQFCSKSYVQRWVYLICDHCCRKLNISLIPGCHIPLNADVNFLQKKIDEQKDTAEAAGSSSGYDYSKKQQASPWVPVVRTPLPRPQKPSNLAAMLPPRNQSQFAPEDFPSMANIAASLPSRSQCQFSPEDFPSIAVRGRGKTLPQGNNKGNPSFSFADATKK